MADELTVREQRLVKGVVQGKSKRQAAIDAGYSPKSANAIAHEALRKPTVQAAFQRALKKAGITEDKLAQVMREGLDAQKVISAVVVGADANEKTQDFIDVPDHPTRHKFLETAIKVKGLDPAVKVQHTGIVGTIDLDRYLTTE